MWNDNESDEDSDDDAVEEEVDDFVIQDHAPGTVRLRGQVLRDELMDGMAP